MADGIVHFESFGKYGPVAGTFLSYTPANDVNFLGPNAAAVPGRFQGFLQEFLSTFGSTGSSMAIITGRAGGASKALIISDGSGNTTYALRSLPTNYARHKFGFAFIGNLGTRAGIEFLDAGTAQNSVWVTAAGTIVIGRGAIGGTALFTSGAVILTSQWNYIEVDIKTHNSTGTIELKLNGVVVAGSTLTGLNTRAGTNDYINQYKLYAISATAGFDDVYISDNTGGTAAYLGDLTVDELTLNGDSAVQFTPTATVVGPYIHQITSASAAPAAGSLVLIPVTPPVNMTINSIVVLPRGTSASAKFKGVIYSDSGGAPNALLSSGTEAVSCTSGVNLSLPLVTPQALTGGTQYWIGFINDTSVAMQTSDVSAIGRRIANTYASGAPGTAGAMTTGQTTWAFWGIATSPASNYAAVLVANGVPMSEQIIQGYIQSATVNHEDLYTVTDLGVTPTTIYGVQVNVFAARSDSGAKTMDIRLKSGSTTGSGNNSGITPPTTFAWQRSLFVTNPATAAAFTASEVNSMLVGQKVIS